MSTQGKIQGPVCSFDVATTYSVVAHYRNGRAEVFANDQGNRSTPSVVSFSGNERLVGDAAKNQAALNPTNTIYEIKRLMGCKWSDPKVQECIKRFPFKVVNKNDKPCVEVEYMGEVKTFTPEEITAMVIGDLKKTAETALGEKVTHATVTIPAYFNEQARQATKDAATIAGLNVIRLISEPTAATIAYGFDKSDSKAKNVITIDAGGGTYDISVLTMEGEVFEVKAVSGDRFLGGADFDNCLRDHCKDEFKRQSGVDISSNWKALRRLYTACERAKRALSTAATAEIEVDSLAEGKDFTYTISRARFESLCMHLFRRHIDLIEPVLKEAKLGKGDISEVILVGGTTRIPKLRQMISDFFGGKKLCTEINPDEAIAVGAAIQAAALSGQKDRKLGDLLILDVTPLSLGIETVGGMFTKIIDRNATIPCKNSKIFTNNDDNQPSVNIQIFEGERAMTKDCSRLGNFSVSGLPPAKRGTLKIVVGMDMDADGILVVTAKEETSGKEGQIKITNDTNRLTTAQRERMVKEAETYREQDEKIRAGHDALNKFDALIAQSRDSAESAQQLSAEDKARIKEECAKAEEWLRDRRGGEINAEEIESRRRAFQDVAYSILSPAQGETKQPKVEECD